MTVFIVQLALHSYDRLSMAVDNESESTHTHAHMLPALSG